MQPEINLDRCTINNMISCIGDELRKNKINLSYEVIERILIDGIQIIDNHGKKNYINNINIANQPKEYDEKILNAIAAKYFQDPFYKNLNEIKLYFKSLISYLKK
jgi:hypothetical protein